MSEPRQPEGSVSAEESCELLFEYLRSILYDSEINRPDFGRLSAPFEKLGAGLLVLQRFVEEAKAYSEDLSNGELSGAYPSHDNFLCANLKNLHANLNHLTWQAKRVAAGDYTQHVSYLGEFSDAFNTMIEQLKAREENLHEQIDRTQRQMDIIEQYNELFADMMTRRNVWFVVVDAETGETRYCNRHPSARLHQDISCGGCKCGSSCLLQEILRKDSPASYKTWELGDEQTGFYRVSSMPVEWRGKNAFVHIVEDVTEEKREEGKLASRAYFDAGTGIHNRYFFEEYLSEQLSQHTDMLLCYMDLDNLKYVNDHFGHCEGDAYIRSFVAEISNSFRATDVFARIGGDEFCLLLPKANLEQMRNKLEQVREHFISTNSAAYPVSFSFGLIKIDGDSQWASAEPLLAEADRLMYEYKKTNKPPKPLP